MEKSIYTATQLLEEIYKVGLEDNKDFQAKSQNMHTGIIGDMYEGLSRNIVEKAIFKDLNLKVVKGQILNHNDKLSNQIDCMIVKDFIKKAPYGENYICDIKDVIAVIEIKKNLYSSDLEDGYLKMQNLTENFDIEKIKDKIKIKEDDLLDSFKAITGRNLDDLKKYTGENLNEKNFDSLLINILIQEMALPLRIIWGHTGYVDENGLRNGFVKLLEENEIKKGPLILPNLIICGDSTLIKSNGLPYGIRFREKEYTDWTICSSYDKTPLLILLEVIWKRLCLMFDTIDENIFGRYVKNESLFPLLIYSLENYNGKCGFIGNIFEEKLKRNCVEKMVDTQAPKKIKISRICKLVFERLVQGENVFIDDEGLINILKKDGKTIEELKTELLETGYIKFDENEILLRKQFSLISCELGEWYVIF